MALKPKIYKFNISLSDLNRDYYDSLNLTIAQHPSETDERMMARVLAYCINAQEFLEFTKGISAADEPDIWARTLDGTISLWIDVGEPNAERTKKATRIASAVKVYSFNSKSDIWWKQGQEKFSKLKASVFQFQPTSIQKLVGLLKRSTDLSITITENTAYITSDLGACDVSWVQLQAI